jgi:hypothetical protein
VIGVIYYLRYEDNTRTYFSVCFDCSYGAGYNSGPTYGSLIDNDPIATVMPKYLGFTTIGLYRYLNRLNRAHVNITDRAKLLILYC